MKTTFDYRSALEARLSSLGYGREGLEGLYEPVRYGLEGGGKRNESAYLPYVCRQIAATLGVDESAVEAATDANARQLFLT